MPLWDTADLLRRAKRLARRPDPDQAAPDLAWYDWLTEAQQEVYDHIFTRFPDYAYSAPQQLVTADGGVTYTFGLDADGALRRPFGHIELYANPTAIPDSPLVPGTDFIFEGGLIRFPGGRPRSFSGGAPWARFWADPDVAIDATHEPLLQPKSARILLVYKAVEIWASRPGSGARTDYYEKRYAARRLDVWAKLATQYNMQGSQAAGSNVDKVWWYSQDLGGIAA